MSDLAVLRSAAVVDLLGLLAYGELQAFDQMAADARLAPDLHRRAVLSAMAAAEIVNYRRLNDRLTARGADPETVMRPFVAPLEQYHDQTAPKDWLERPMKTLSTVLSFKVSKCQSRLVL